MHFGVDQVVKEWETVPSVIDRQAAPPDKPTPLLGPLAGQQQSNRWPRDIREPTFWTVLCPEDVAMIKSN